LVTYDTNVARSDEATALRRGLVREEFIYQPTLALDIIKPFGEQAVFLQGSVGYDHHDQNGALDAARVSTVGGVSRRFGRCNLALTGGYNSQQTDLADLLLSNTVRNIQETKQVGIGGGCGGGIGLTETFGVSYQRTDNTAAVLESADNRSTTSTIGIGYGRPSFGIVQLIGSYTRADFPNAEVVSAIQPTTGYSSWSSGVKFEHQIGTKIDGTVTVGYTDLRTRGGAVPGFRGLTYQGTLTYRLSHRIRFAATFDDEARPANRPGASYTVDRQYQISGHYSVNSRAGIDIGFSDNRSRYDEFLTLVGPATRINDDIKAEFVTMNYNIGRRITLLFDVRHEDRDVPLPGLSVPDNRISFTITGTY
ncbi:MAG: outer membrane beta-barrel protein, partial [Proteobacteria bacterium]|nr:outer membrane beta-barrel protein [Pseudomonadota bacterium]